MNSDLHVLTTLYALDSLPVDEAERYERHLEGCPTCRLEVDELRAAAAELSVLSEVEPPAAMRQAVLDQITETPQQRVDGVVRPFRRPTSKIAVRLLAAAAAVLLFVAAGAIAVSFLTDSSDLEKLKAEPDAREVMLSPPDLDARFTYSRAERRAALEIDDLAVLSAAETYQIWYVVPDRDPLGVATFNPDDAGMVAHIVDADLSKVGIVAVTVEPAGGSASPTGEILISGELA